MAVTVKSKGEFLARKCCHSRVCKRVVGTPSRSRLMVSRSNRHMFVQVVDSSVGHTLVVTSTYETELRSDGGTKADKVCRVGELVAKRTLRAGISSVTFDRGGNKYHGHVTATTEGARAVGLTL